MIGNSLKSDILPLLNIKSKAIHVPFHTTWAHEEVTLEESKNKQFHTLKTLKQLPELLQC